MEKYLQESYGILIYQEQLIMLSRLIAGFRRGESDCLRKAFCKRKQAVLDELKPRFIEGGVSNGHNKKTLEIIWEEWKHIGGFSFNKTHAVCYSWLGYQMAYLKANYLEEFLSVMRKSD